MTVDKTKEVSTYAKIVAIGVPQFLPTTVGDRREIMYVYFYWNKPATAFQKNHSVI